MSNRLSMAQTQAIQALAATGQSNRAISRALGVDRGTVAKTFSQIQNQPPIWEAPTGSEGVPTGALTSDVIAEDCETHVCESHAERCPASIELLAVVFKQERVRLGVGVGQWVAGGHGFRGPWAARALAAPQLLACVRATRAIR